MYGYKYIYTVATLFISVCACNLEEKKEQKKMNYVPLHA